MQSHEIRKRFLDFFEKRGHAVLPSASLVPENDPSVLFNTAGMQPLVPYLLGEKHPKGVRLVNAQKCVRTNDIEEVGDNTHFTFFEMLGNWSLGDYFKEDAIKWSYEFLTSTEEGLGLDPARLYVTVFEGNEDAPRDEEAADIWKTLVPENRIYYLPAENNWWSPGDNGPCGPDSEMFYDLTSEGLGDLSHDEFLAADDRQDVVEIWNDVFMQYLKKDGKVVGQLENKNVDTGAGLERLTAVLQGKPSPYETDLFADIIAYIEGESGKQYGEHTKAFRVTADHIRTAIFMIADGVRPSNKDQGYVLRRLIRRAALQMRNIEFDSDALPALIDLYINKYSGAYDNLTIEKTIIHEELLGEVAKFSTTLEKGMKQFEKIDGDISGEDAFQLFSTYGFPIEVTEELAADQGVHVDRDGYEKAFADHQQLSQTASAGKFKGGLADASDETVRLHTAHHLLLAALQKHVDPSIKQRGSNITAERMRMDFTFDRKLTDEEREAVENQVNEWIGLGLKVIKREMPLAEAEQIGAEMEFGAKYPDVVSVYFVETDDGSEVVSKEFCGGPHVESVSELGTFKIKKEESSSKGVRRIKAVLEQ